MLVQKYGGTSVATLEKINAIAKTICEKIKEEQKIIIVVSAQSGETDKLISLGLLAGDEKREIDQLISIGENKTISLMALALNKLNVKAVSLTGWQAGIVTTNKYGSAYIDKIKLRILKNYLTKYDVLVIAGFQGVTKGGSITTLGKGGSDTTAVALASVLKCRCEIYTDVSGVFTADPKIISSAKRIDKLSYDELMEMSANGAKVMETRSVEIAKKFGTPLEIKKTLGNKKEGTIVMDFESSLEEIKIKNITSKDNVCLVSFEIDGKESLGVLLKTLNDENEKISFLNVQNIARKNIVNFLIDCKNLQKINKKLQKIIKNKLKTRNYLTKVTLIGSGFMTHTEILSRIFEVLNKEEVEYFGVSVSEISISFLVEDRNKIRVIEKLNKEFLE